MVELSCRPMEVKWNKYFDAVYCISLADNIQRRDDLARELKRVGIKKCFWKITVRNEFYRLIWTNPRFRVEKWWMHLEGPLNATLAHYEVMKEALALGYKRILILEDDVRFLKNLKDIEEALGNMPACDIALLDKCIPFGKERYFSELEKSQVNDYWLDFANVKLWSAACYAVSAKAMDVITRNQLRCFIPADHATNRVDNLGKVVNDDGLRRVASIRNIAVQNFFYKKEQNETDKLAYTEFVNLEDYAL